jgi:hypothetical protein
VGWLEQNSRGGAGSRFFRETAAEIDRATENAAGFHLGVGSKLLRSGKAAILVVRAGELYVFELSPEQAAAIPLADNGRFFQPILVPDRRRPEPRFALSGLAFDGGTRFRGNDKVAGSVLCRNGGAAEGPFALRMTYFGPGKRYSAFYHLRGKAAPPTGPLPFAFGPFHPAVAGRSGPLVLFLELCDVPDPKAIDSAVVDSNTLAVLVDVKPAKGAAD